MALQTAEISKDGEVMSYDLTPCKKCGEMIPPIYVSDFHVCDLHKVRLKKLFDETSKPQKITNQLAAAQVAKEGGGDE